MATAAIAIPMSQFKTAECFTNPFPMSRIVCHVECSRDIPRSGPVRSQDRKPESFPGRVAASTSLGMTVMRCCDHIEIGTGKIRDTILRLRSLSHSWDMDLAVD